MNATEPKRYDPATDKIPAGHYKIVWDREKQRIMLVEVVDNVPL